MLDIWKRSDNQSLKITYNIIEIEIYSILRTIDLNNDNLYA